MGGVDDKCTTLYTARVTLNTHATHTCLRLEIDFLARFEVEKLARVACNRDALVHPVALQETLRDLPLHVTNAGTALSRTRQTKKHNNSPPQLTTTTCVTLLLPFSPSAIPRNPTSDNKRLPSCITRRHMRPQPPTPSHIHIRTSHTNPSPPHMPLLTKLIVFRRLNRPRFTHSG